MSIKAFLEALPKIATQPLAILAFIVLAVGWIVLQLRRRKSKEFIEALEAQNKKDRPEFCRRAGYSYSELAGLTRQDQARMITRRYWLLAYLATLVALVLFALGVRKSVTPKEINERLDELTDSQERTLAEIRQASVSLLAVIETNVQAGKMTHAPGKSIEASDPIAEANEEKIAQLEARLAAVEPRTDLDSARLQFSEAVVTYGRFRNAVYRTGDKSPHVEKLLETAYSLADVYNVFVAAGVPVEAMDCANLAGAMLRSADEFDRALSYYEKAEAIARQHRKNEPLRRSLRGQTQLHLVRARELADPEAAMTEAKRADVAANNLVAVTRALNDEELLTEALTFSCEAKQEIKDWPAALQLANQAVALAEQGHNVEYRFFAVLNRHSICFIMADGWRQTPGVPRYFCKVMVQLASDDLKQAREIAKDAGWQFMVEQCDFMGRLVEARLAELSEVEKPVDLAATVAGLSELPPGYEEMIAEYIVD